MQTPEVTVWAMGWASVGHWEGGYLIEGTKLAGGERCCRESALQRRGALVFGVGRWGGQQRGGRGRRTERRAELLERARVRSIWETIAYWGIDFKTSEETEKVPSDNGFYVVDIAVAGRAFDVFGRGR